jgi:hypothetical protein
VRSATTVWADWVWTMATSCVGAAVGGGVPQALSARLRTTKSVEKIEIRVLMFLFMVFLSYICGLQVDLIEDREKLIWRSILENDIIDTGCPYLLLLFQIAGEIDHLG